MPTRSLRPRRPGRRAAGVGVFELFVLALLLALLLFILLPALLLPVLAQRTDAARRTRCSAKLHNLYVGMRSYLVYHDDYFPLAWHVPGKPRADLANVSYHRFLLHEQMDRSFRRIVDTKKPAESAARKFQQTRKAWEDPAAGATRDYFAPLLVFTGHRGAKGNLDPTHTGKFDKHTSYSELAHTGVHATDRPMLAGVDASYANAQGKGMTPGHEAELRRGWQTVQCLGSEVFLGVGPSLRKAGDLSSSRFDFRHRGTVNILFLDGHSQGIKKTDTDRLRRIHAAWNKL